MIKKLLILSGFLIIIGGIGTVFTKLNTKENSEIISIPANNDSSHSTTNSSSLEQLQIQYTNSEGKTFDEIFSMETDGESILIQEKRKSNIQFFSAPMTSNLEIQGTSEQIKKVDIFLVSTNLTLTNLEAAQITVSSVSGDLDLTNVKATSINLESVSGDIDLTETIGDLKFSSTSGDIDLENNELTNSIYGSTVSGDILLYFTEDPTDVTFNGKTISGDVSFLYDNDKKVKLGNGHLTIDLETVSGDIAIE